MSPEISIRVSEAGRRYEAVLRISEALSACREPEDLTRILSEQLGEFLDFFQFYIIVYKENSTEIEWAVVGSEKSLISAYMCRYKSGHHGEHMRHRNRSTLQNGMPTNGCRRGSSTESRPKVFRSGRSSLCPLRHRIGAWALWACPDTRQPLTPAKTLASCA